jgi:hypothetical protein
MGDQSWDGAVRHVAGYLDTASIGLPPVGTADATVDVVQGWRDGRERPQDFDQYVDRARADQGVCLFGLLGG